MVQYISCMTTDTIVGKVWTSNIVVTHHGKLVDEILIWYSHMHDCHCNDGNARGWSTVWQLMISNAYRGSFKYAGDLFSWAIVTLWLPWPGLIICNFDLAISIGIITAYVLLMALLVASRRFEYHYHGWKLSLQQGARTPQICQMTFVVTEWATLLYVITLFSYSCLELSHFDT
jgi:hypothetical protein